MVGPWPYTQQATTRGGGICGPVQPSNTIHGWRTDIPVLAIITAATAPSRHTQPPPGHGCSFKSWLYAGACFSNPFIRSPKGTHSRGSDYLDRHAAVNVKAVYSQYVSAKCDTLYGAPSHSLTHQAVIRGGGICGPARDAERCVASFQLSYVQ
jgi:hypothetical protein